MTATRPRHRRRKLAPSISATQYLAELQRTGRRQELRFPGPRENPEWWDAFWSREREARRRIPPNSPAEDDFITQAVLQRLRIRGRNIEWLLSDGEWELTDSVGPYRSMWFDHYVRNFVRWILSCRGHSRLQVLRKSRAILEDILDLFDEIAAEPM